MSKLPPFDVRARKDPLTGEMVYPEKFHNGPQDGDAGARPRLMATRHGHECPLTGPIAEEDRRAGIQDGDEGALVGVPGSAYALQVKRSQVEKLTANQGCGCRGRCKCPSEARPDAGSHRR